MIEKTILSHLINDEKYARKIIPFLKEEYFQNTEDKIVFKTIVDYINSYNQLPTKEALYIDIGKITTLDESSFKKCKDVVASLSVEASTNFDWLIENTENFCKDKALYNSIRESIQIMDNKSKRDKGEIPVLIQEALQVSFDIAIGHDFIGDSEKRYKFYTHQEARIPFDIDLLNKITNGGLLPKTLNSLMAPPGAGKTMVMCHMAGYNLISNKNVLYITLEMAEEEIAKRIDANLLDLTMKEILSIPKNDYIRKMNKLESTVKGKLIIKEYPTTYASALHFRSLLRELALKKKFVPDIIYIDYMNLCASSRIKMSSNVNSYAYIKSIAEELRGLAVEMKLPIVTATQTNRSGMNDSDFGMENTSDCIGIDQLVHLKNGDIRRIDELKLGDQIVANDQYKTVIKVHHKKIKNCYKITTKSGKTIICSEDHMFPSKDSDGNIFRKNIKNGLKEGYYLNTK